MISMLEFLIDNIFFLLAIVLSVLLRYTDYSYYLFGIFQRFFLLIKTKEFDVLFSVTLNNIDYSNMIIYLK